MYTTYNPVIPHFPDIRLKQGHLTVTKEEVQYHKTPTQNHINYTQEIPVELKSETSLPNYSLKTTAIHFASFQTTMSLCGLK